MAKIAGRISQISYAAITLSGDLNTTTMSIDATLPETTSFGDLDTTYVEASKDTKWDIAGNFNPAAGQNDATLFARFGSGAATVTYNPGAATTGFPSFSQSAFVKSYKVTSGVKAAVTMSAQLQGSGTLTRTVL